MIGVKRMLSFFSGSSRIVFDRWIEIELLDPEAAQRSLAAAIWLRTSLDRLLRVKLEGAPLIGLLTFYPFTGIFLTKVRTGKII